MSKVRKIDSIDFAYARLRSKYNFTSQYSRMHKNFDSIVDTISHVGKKFDKLQSVGVKFNGCLNRAETEQEIERMKIHKRLQMIQMLDKYEFFW